MSGLFRKTDPEGWGPDWLWAIGWWFKRRWLTLKWWLYTGGKTERHPHHVPVWTAVMGVFAAFGIALLFFDGVFLILGGVCLAAAFWVLLSFFLPLPLPPLRDERLIKLRREAMRQGVVNALRASTGEPVDALADQLRVGHAIRKTARLAESRDELFEAAQQFIEWVNAVDEQVLTLAPEDYAELPQRAPWTLQGKKNVLDAMDARLVAYSRIVKRLRGGPQQT
jgi:hypothetical protein